MRLKQPWHLLGIDADGSICAQKELENRLEKRIDLHSHQDNLRFYANRHGLALLRQTIKNLRSHCPASWLTFLGSGDFHHFTAVLLETLPETVRPLNLVLIDNHPDWFDMPLRYHCGTWVSTVLELPWVESITIIGVDSADLNGREFWFAPFRDLCNGRVQLYPYRRQSVQVPLRWATKVLGASAASNHASGVEITFETVCDLGIKQIADKLEQQLAGKNVYLTIDKDVLDPQYASTDWDQGHLSLSDIQVLIKTLCTDTKLVGADIVGEHAPEPLRGPWKRWDAERLFQGPVKGWDTINTLNQTTNLILLETFIENLS